MIKCEEDDLHCFMLLLNYSKLPSSVTLILFSTAFIYQLKVYFGIDSFETSVLRLFLFLTPTLIIVYNEENYI